MKCLLILFVTSGFALLPAAAQDKPAAAGEKKEVAPGNLTADQILDTVKNGLPDLPPLSGVLQKNGKEVPILLKMTGPLTHISFENPKQDLTLEAGEKSSSLKEKIAGTDKEVPAVQYSTAIDGTDLTYEDLSMRYLYWPKKEIREEESIKAQPCYVVDLYNPERQGDYLLVRLFIRKASGAIMRMNDFDWNGKLIKSCFITTAMKIPDAQGKTVMVLKSMEIIRYVPGTKKAASQTKLELRRPQ